MSNERQPSRRQDWAGLGPSEVLALYRPGQAPPMQVLEVLLTLFNARHTALEKTVSHKTRHERAMFLRRFFRDLKLKAGFKTLPDPRHLGYRHVQAMVDVWRRERLAPATVQTYLSFLRGLAQWLGKHGLIRAPAYYGLQTDEYQRHEAAERDRSWSGNGVDIEPLIEQIVAYDRFVGVQVIVMRALGLRRKEAIMLRPRACVVPFESLGWPEARKEAERYVRIKAGAKGGRPRVVPLDSPLRTAAIERALAVAEHADSHLGDPTRSLQQNLRRFNYVLTKFGLTYRERGATGHGLRHEAAHEGYRELTGELPPVRGGQPVARSLDHDARLRVAALAGHGRIKASAAYLGQSVVMRSKGLKQSTPSETALPRQDVPMATGEVG